MKSPIKLNEPELAQKIKQGDESAFIEVYEQYWKPLFNYGFNKLGKKEIVEGIVQEVFIDLWTKRKTLEIHTSLSSYLFQAVHFRVINKYKAQKVRENFSLNEQLKVEHQGSPVEERIIFKELKRMIKKITKSFPLQRKKVYDLRFKKGLSYLEIAEETNLSTSTIEKHLIQAKKEIRNQLAGYTFIITALATSPELMKWGIY